MREAPSQIAKITRPRLSGVLQRDRLFTMLDEGRTRSVIWVSGPPGSGKTTLVSSYLDARALSSIWYQVDEGDADIATFFYYMGRAAPKKRKPLPLLTPEYLQDIPTFTRRYFENLYGRLKPPFALVFDNYHAVPAESPFHEVLSTGLSQLPEGCFAIVISRTEPPPAFARLRAHEQIALIEDQALRLTDEESYALAELRGLGKEAPDTVRILHQRTEGWAAGLQLAALSLQGQRDASHFISTITGSQRFITDYLTEEVLDRQPRQGRHGGLGPIGLGRVEPAACGPAGAEPQRPAQGAVGQPSGNPGAQRAAGWRQARRRGQRPGPAPVGNDRPGDHRTIAPAA